ncbi:MAG: adenosine kinase [Gammaproteobacteria bacterium]|nr:adenosine kinase [Gammaproteobacteria bacterium]
MTKYHVYAIGNAIVDKEFEVSDELFAEKGFEKGYMTLVDEADQQKLIDFLKSRYGLKKRASGGSAANTITAIQYFGGKTFLSCKVANDEPGNFYAHDLAAAGIHSNLKIEREQGTTGRCVVMVSPDAERTMHTCLGLAGSISEMELVPDLIELSEYLYIEGYLVTSDSARAAAISAKKIAIKSGNKTAITFSDPSMVQHFKTGLTEIIGEGVDLLFCNKEEALLWSDSDSLTDAAEALRKVARQFAITLGAEGALLFDGQAFINIKPFAATAVDSNGAGDMFAGAFLYGITHGYSFAEAGRLASYAASVVVANFGPRLEAAQHTLILSEHNLG